MKRKHKNKVASPQSPKKMSEMLIDFAWAFAIQDRTDLQERQHFMNIAVTAWNMSLLSGEICEEALKSYVEWMNLHSGGRLTDANLKALESDLHALIKLKNKLYPTVRKLVASADLFDDGGKVGCRAASSDYDSLVNAELAKQKRARR